MHSGLVGFGLGFAVALQFGPMSLFLIRSTLRGRWSVGIAIAAGISAIDGLYAAAGASGVSPLLEIGPLRIALGLTGAVVLIALGVRTFYQAFRVRLGGELEAEVATPRRAFATALAGTASNPLTIVSWAAIFAAASTAGAARTTTDAALLVAGVTLGSLTWGTILTCSVSAVGRIAGERALRIADVAAGLGLVGFGGALMYVTVHDR